MSTITISIEMLRELGIEVLPRGPADSVTLPKQTRIEAPSSLNGRTMSTTGVGGVFVPSIWILLRSAN